MSVALAVTIDRGQISCPAVRLESERCDVTALVYHRWVCEACGGASSWLDDMERVERMRDAHANVHADNHVMP